MPHRAPLGVVRRFCADPCTSGHRVARSHVLFARRGRRTARANRPRLRTPRRLWRAQSRQAGKQASRQAGKQASRQAGKQASRQAGKQVAGKQASRQAGKQVAGKQASRWRRHRRHGLLDHTTLDPAPPGMCCADVITAPVAQQDRHTICHQHGANRARTVGDCAIRDDVDGPLRRVHHSIAMFLPQPQGALR